MKITLTNSLVEFVPESEKEKDGLDAVWKKVLDYNGFNKKLVAVGEYVPEKQLVARFNIED